MLESELELVPSQAEDSLTRAWREAGKKGHADKPTVLRYAEQLGVVADKFWREHASKQESVAATINVEQKVKDQVSRLIETTEAGKPNIQTVIRTIELSADTSKAIAEHPHAVIALGIQKMAENALKASKRTDALPEDERQGYFDFYNLAEFRRVCRMIHYFNPETSQWQYIPYAESLAKHRNFRIEKLREKVADDEATLKAEIEADGVLAKEVASQGDLPAWQLIAGRPVPPKTRGRRRTG